VNKRTILVGVAILLPVLSLAAALHGLALTMGGVAVAQGPAPEGEVGVQAALGTGFTYQGQLLQSGSPITDTCDMAFRLYDAATSGSQVGSAITPAVAITNGLFTVALDFGSSGTFDGQARWLGIQVNCTGSWTDLGRQALTPAPYALALPGLWTQQNATSPNLIGGYSGNSVGPGLGGVAIGGGGSGTGPNQVTGSFGVVGGGWSNQVGGQYAAIGGGASNRANGQYAAVGGGSSNQAGANWATVDGGDQNQATAQYAVVGGGYGNQAISTSATVGGGYVVTASGQGAAVGGGYYNQASGQYATIGGGKNNRITGEYGVAGGGYNNQTLGFAATVPGGYSNLARSDYSFAAGHLAYANQPGCFTWGDSTNAIFNCDVADAFLVRASGGVTLYTSSTLTSGVYLTPGGSSWNTVSARARKENFEPVDGAQLLARLGEIDITTWNYRSQSPAIRHIGPMADDFNGLVAGLGGEGQDYINSLDADGVALAAIQALAAENAALRARLDSLEARLAALEAAQGGGR
jgi:hypothetical protein